MQGHLYQFDIIFSNCYTQEHKLCQEQEQCSLILHISEECDNSSKIDLTRIDFQNFCRHTSLWRIIAAIKNSPMQSLFINVLTLKCETYK